MDIALPVDVALWYGIERFIREPREWLQGGTPMPLRFGPGPVFIYESISAARRWQVYACGPFLC